MNLKSLLFVLNLLLVAAIAQGEEEIVVTNARLEFPELFEKTVIEHIQNNYEAEHFTDMEKIKERVEFCNPRKKLSNPQTFRGNFKLCMDLFVFDLWAGTGEFSITNQDALNRKLTLSGSAPFIGGQIILPYRLGKSIIMEGKYWYFPSFTTARSTAENLRTSSVFESMLILHQRISRTGLSLRLGGVGYKVPVAKDLNNSIFARQAQIEFRSVLLAGLLAGLKYTPDKNKGTEHLFYGDLIFLPYTDNRFFNEFTSSYVLRTGYKWFFTRRMALTFDGTIKRFNTKTDESISTTLWGAGLQLFLF
jgi:hypothetical protein